MTFSLSGAGLAMGVTIAFGVGSSIVGTLGVIGELAVKKMIDKEEMPISRAVGEVFAKTIQSTAAAFSLLIIGSLFVPTIGLIGLMGIGTIMILTPTINELVQHQNQNSSWKKALDMGDKVVSVTSKAINAAVLTAGISMAFGVPAAILGGLGLGVVNIMAYKNSK